MPAQSVRLCNSLQLRISQIVTPDDLLVPVKWPTAIVRPFGEISIDNIPPPVPFLVLRLHNNSGSGKRANSGLVIFFACHNTCGVATDLGFAATEVSATIFDAVGVSPCCWVLSVVFCSSDFIVIAAPSALESNCPDFEGVIAPLARSYSSTFACFGSVCSVLTQLASTTPTITIKSNLFIIFLHFMKILNQPRSFYLKCQHLV